jgi:hypothetical protein
MLDPYAAVVPAAAGRKENDMAGRTRRWLRMTVAVGMLAAAGVAATAAPAAAANNYLGTEWDQCSGNLYVEKPGGGWQYIPKNDTNNWATVTLNGSGYWDWKCGTTGEVSRGSLPWRYRVDRLLVRHASDGREIRWRCYEVV